MVIKTMWSQRIADILINVSYGPLSWSFVQFLLSDLCFLGITRGLLSAIDCTPTELRMSGGEDFIQLDAMANADEVMECWQSEHLW
eukprot:SAG11_NODE_288_length_11198_cov_29.339130_4_plen_86_part_00